MIVNVVDSTVRVPPGQPGARTVNLPWQVGSPVPLSPLREVGIGRIDLMRIIAPHTDLGLLMDLLTRALPLLRAFFAPNGLIEIYGRKSLNTIGGSLRGDALMTQGGALRRDTLNTIGGSLRGDNLITVGGALRSERLSTAGGSLAPDQLWAVIGAERITIRP